MSKESDTKKVELKNSGLRQVRLSTALMLVVLFSSIAFIVGGRIQSPGQYLAGLTGGNSGTLDVSSLYNTYNTLRDNYDGELDVNALIDGANKGLVDAAGDKYTKYFTAKEYKDFMTDLEGSLSGIGVQITIKDSYPLVVKPLDNTPAKKGGLKKGDFIYQVNGESVKGWTIDKVVEKIRGEEGTTVKLLIHRGDTEDKEYTITRASIDIPSVEFSMKDNGVAYIAMSRFSESTYGEFKSAIQKAKDNKATSLVVDLRNNGGGHLDTAIDIVDLWLEPGIEIVSQRKGGKIVESSKSKRDAPLANMKTVILVNEMSASASEIMAGALKDHGKATLIGVKTFGKGTVQRLVPVEGGAHLKVTINRWFTPSGHNISEKGIDPDKEVQISVDDLKKDKDPQLDAALKYVK